MQLQFLAPEGIIFKAVERLQFLTGAELLFLQFLRAWFVMPTLCCQEGKFQPSWPRSRVRRMNSLRNESLRSYESFVWKSRTLCFVATRGHPSRTCWRRSERDGLQRKHSTRSLCGIVGFEWRGRERSTNCRRASSGVERCVRNAAGDGDS